MKNNSILKMVLCLVIIAVVVSGLLAVVNNMTAPLIEKNNEDKLNRALSGVVEADNFTIHEENEGYTIYVAKKNSAVSGYAVLNRVKGYGGEITLLTGISTELTVTGVEILSMSETPGLGANAGNEAFKTSFTGKTEKIEVVKNSPKGNQIQALSGATITSKAVTNGINNALELVKEAF